MNVAYTTVYKRLVAERADPTRIKFAVVYQGHVQREFKCREDAWDYLVQRGWRWDDEASIAAY